MCIGHDSTNMTNTHTHIFFYSQSSIEKIKSGKNQVKLKQTEIGSIVEKENEKRLIFEQ